MGHPLDPADSALPDDPRRPWRAFVAARGLKASKIREAIVEAFLAEREHVAPETLLAAARRRNPRVGLATVYRTIRLMEEAGLAHARRFGSGAALYEVAAGRPHHDHLICQRCGRISEFHDPAIERLQDAVAAAHGFEVVEHRHELYGLCAACRGAAGGAT
jgi:Fur family ferric uptake transcriptional regulator